MTVSNKAPTFVLVHGAWADGTSWHRVIHALEAAGATAVAAPIPLTSVSNDIRALDRCLARIERPSLLAAHAYAGAVISGSRNERVKGLVFVAALAPDEGETVGEVFGRGKPHPKAPQLAPDADGFSGCRKARSLRPSRRTQAPARAPCSPPCSGRFMAPVCKRKTQGRSGKLCRPGTSWRSRIA